MTTIKTLLTLLVLSLSVLSAHAKIWRVNNNAGVVTNFTTFNDAVISPLVLAGDTVHIEASATNYTVPGTLTKRLVVIGVGYFLDPANTTTPGNSGLQANTLTSILNGFTVGEGANGSKFLGLSFNVTVASGATTINLTFEKCLMTSLAFNNSTHNGITVRKCFLTGTIAGASGSLTNFVCENNIFSGFSGYLDLPILTGTSNIVRNNSFRDTYRSLLVNCYVANNIFPPSYQNEFTNCTIKNNLFVMNQTLPVTATGNPSKCNCCKYLCWRYYQ